MTILGLDCAGKTASAALWQGGVILAETNLNLGYTHSETLLPMVDGLFSLSRLEPGAVDLFAVTTGPGSFTGLRIGISTIKGMAFPGDTPCVGVSTLEAAAFGLRHLTGTVMAAFDARLGQVYCATFRAGDGELTRLSPDRATLIEELGTALRDSHGPVFLCGDGAGLVLERFSGEMPEMTIPPVASVPVMAASVCRIAANSADRVPAGSLMPSYLRIPQAERERQNRCDRSNGAD